MKNRGFTLVEILAVIVIIGILATMATLGVTRIRKNADDKDRFNLHSALQTSFDNYRTVLVMNGEPQIDILTIDDNMPVFFEKYITDLSYYGKRLSKADIEGTVIRTFKKGDALNNSTYTSDVIDGISNYSTLSEEQQKEALEKQYIIDSTCMVESKVINPGQDDAKIEKFCKVQDGQILPSKDEITCLKIKYNGEIIVNDFDSSENVLQINNLCGYMSE